MGFNNGAFNDEFANNLVTDNPETGLAASQGVVIKSLIDDLQTLIDNINAGSFGLDSNGFILNSLIKPNFKTTTGVVYNGTNQYHTIANDANLNPAQFSFEVFAYFSTIGNLINILSKVSGTAGLRLFKTATDTIRFEYGASVAETTSTVGIGFSHIVVSYNNGTFAISINGRTQSLNGSPSASSLSTQTNTADILIAKYSTSYSAIGVFIFRLYNYALPTSEITSLWNGARPQLYRIPIATLHSSNDTLVANGDFALGTGNVFTNWSLQPSGSSTITESAAGGVGGSRAIAMNVDSSNSFTNLVNTGQFVVGVRYNYSVYAYVTSGTGTIAIGNSNLNAINLALTTTPTLFTGTFICGYAEPIAIKRIAMTSKTALIDNLVISKAGCVLSLQPENCFSDKWLSNSNNYFATPSNSPTLLTEDYYADSSILADYNIVSINGANTANLTLPAGYYVDKVQLINKTSGVLNLSDLTIGGISLISGKTVPATSSGVFSLLGDQIVSSSSQSIVVTTSTTSTAGYGVVITIKKIA